MKHTSDDTDIEPNDCARKRGGGVFCAHLLILFLIIVVINFFHFTFFIGKPCCFQFSLSDFFSIPSFWRSAQTSSL